MRAYYQANFVLPVLRRLELRRSRPEVVHPEPKSRDFRFPAGLSRARDDEGSAVLDFGPPGAAAGNAGGKEKASMATAPRRSKSQGVSSPQASPQIASTRDSQTSRIHRKLLKTISRVPLYPRRFSSPKLSLRIHLNPSAQLAFPAATAPRRPPSGTAPAFAVLALLPHSLRRRALWDDESIRLQERSN